MDYSEIHSVYSVNIIYCTVVPKYVNEAFKCLFNENQTNTKFLLNVLIEKWVVLSYIKINQIWFDILCNV